jgi:NAD(P)-dependent dehydrogenase (short-subunit alcohol dehydrogenase family)
MKTIVITGADRGLGFALAEQCLLAGDLVFMTCLAEPGNDLLQLAGCHPDRVVFIPMDVGNAASVHDAARAIAARTGAIDWLVNNAGILGDIEHSIGEPGFDCDNVLEVFRINTVGPLRVTHALWNLLIAGKDKLLVNITSEAGSITQNFRDRWYGYCLSKAAFNMEGALIHQSLRRLGGRVMQVHPGYVRSYMHGARNENATYEPEEAARCVLAAVKNRSSLPVQEAPDYFDLHGNRLPW